MIHGILQVAVCKMRASKYGVFTEENRHLLKWRLSARILVQKAAKKCKINCGSHKNLCNSYIPSAREVSDLKVKGA